MARTDELKTPREMASRQGQTVFRELPLVCLCSGGDARSAQELADKLGTELVHEEDVAGSDAIMLRVSGDGLSLAADGMELLEDYRELLPRLRQDRLSKELLVKAAKIKHVEHPAAVDATAGLGEDSLMLAAAGFSVELYESNPVIAVLLADAVRRGLLDPDLAPIVSRMHVHEQDSIEALHELTEAPDLVYLDPMFPGRTKSAAVKKKFQLLHHLEAPCDNPEDLLQAAIDAHPRKIVVKRPAKGPYLAGVKPSHSIAGKAVRFDCLILPR